MSLLHHVVGIPLLLDLAAELRFANQCGFLIIIVHDFG